jgi:hypothetical protein
LSSISTTSDGSWNLNNNPAACHIQFLTLRPTGTVTLKTNL